MGGTPMLPRRRKCHAPGAIELVPGATGNAGRASRCRRSRSAKNRDGGDLPSDVPRHAVKGLTGVTRVFGTYATRSRQ